jgi:hypothetical protein
MALAQALQAEDHVDNIHDEVVGGRGGLDSGVDKIDQCRHRPPGRHLPEPSSELPARVGSQQTELGQDRARSGPVLGRRLEEQPVRVPDMRSEERWPGFARHGSEGDRVDHWPDG